MNLNDLKIFEAVAVHGSFTKAAEVMFTVQSNVTARIKTLEEELEAQLFTRTSRKVSLTTSGHAFIQYARKITHIIEEAKNEIKKSDQIGGNLCIGCIETTLVFKAPQILSDFMKVYPHVALEFKSDTREKLIDDVLNYKLDAAFVSAPIHSSQLEQIHIKQDELVIITSLDEKSINHVLKKDHLNIVVFEQGCVYRARLETLLNARGVIQYKSMVMNSIEGIINFVEAGLGITLLPLELVEQYYGGRKLKTFKLSKEINTISTSLIYLKSIPKSQALESFIQMYAMSN
ncbi:LysR family transcriptional regulator [Chryseobacterium sp. T16E-39]|uniref:LysR family transcriptional regulator n=1 Tax=Chryseobacterium sp. T16E-39 TaxID=2015076 RepID=UPI000B5B3C24|nr:LysR family transcriptional regulator [Chryseobacterium sp. T16E-39]ASK29253.1 LysR family transcriptional regulator [Chryseobacterium sp. T16E-39]